MRHIVLPHEAVQKLGAALERARDDRGNFVFIQQNLVCDRERQPQPVGIHFDFLELVCWVPGINSIHFGEAIKILRCPDEVFKDLRGSAATPVKP